MSLLLFALGLRMLLTGRSAQRRQGLLDVLTRGAEVVPAEQVQRLAGVYLQDLRTKAEAAVLADTDAFDVRPRDTAASGVPGDDRDAFLVGGEAYGREKVAQPPGGQHESGDADEQQPPSLGTGGRGDHGEQDGTGELHDGGRCRDTPPVVL